MLEGKRRILVIGSGGAGKSTLAQRLGVATGLPVIHLDREYWQAGWKPTPDDEWSVKLETLLARREWVMDGLYQDTLPRRIERADAVIFLDYPRRVCRYRVLKRILHGFGRVRSDMAPGCPEHLDWGFLRWVWRWHDDIRPRVLEHLGNAGEKLVTLETSAEAERLIDSVRAAAGIRIRLARIEEAPALTELVLESKRHWGYDETLLELWRDDLSITPEVLRRCTVVVAERGGELAGVAAVRVAAGEAELEHLWVHPNAMGRGVGRRLFARTLEIARAGAAASMVIVSDPHAEPFYQKLGARRVDFVPSKPTGRKLPRLRVQL